MGGLREALDTLLLRDDMAPGAAGWQKLATWHAAYQVNTKRCRPDSQFRRRFCHVSEPKSRSGTRAGATRKRRSSSSSSVHWPPGHAASTAWKCFVAEVPRCVCLKSGVGHFSRRRTHYLPW
ncbi:hypothetical protein RB213_003718 [Colletotrichum asianum]